MTDWKPLQEVAGYFRLVPEGGATDVEVIVPDACSVDCPSDDDLAALASRLTGQSYEPSGSSWQPSWGPLAPPEGVYRLGLRVRTSRSAP